jgi:putative Holliday junction resolvase
MRYLAIDYGSKRTGLAVCDAGETIVSPLEVLHGHKGLIERIQQVIVRENIEAVVLGLPLNMDDSEGPQAKRVLAFAEQLRRRLDIPIHLQDERLSSFGAEQKLQETRLSRGKRQERVDALAAAEILETFLEGQEPRQAGPHRVL